jgi:hypothetical protein
MARAESAPTTPEIARARGWEVVRLRRQSKAPDAPKNHPWPISRDADEVARWIARGYNIGLVCHERTGVAVLDPDDVLAWADMIDTLGQPCAPWVITGSGKLHYYIAWEEDLPPKLIWGGQIIGELQRGPGQQQVVLPPSRHPDTGTAYRWITESFGQLCEPINPLTDPLPTLPGLWRAYLRSHVYR